MLIVGSKEVENETVSVRRHKKGDIGTFSFSDFLTDINEEIQTKALPKD